MNYRCRLYFELMPARGHHRSFQDVGGLKVENPHSAALSLINLSALPFFSWPLSSLQKKIGANDNLCMSELFVEFILFFFYMTANAFINGNPTDFVSILPHPFMTHSMDCNGSWETSAACCCWHEPLTPNRPTWWRRRSKFSQPSVSLERKICKCLFFF